MRQKKLQCSVSTNHFKIVFPYNISCDYETITNYDLIRSSSAAGAIADALLEIDNLISLNLIGNAQL